MAIGTPYLIGSGSGQGANPVETITTPKPAGDAVFVLANTAGSVSGVTDTQGNTYIAAFNDVADGVSFWYATYKGSPGTPAAALATSDTVTLTGPSAGNGGIQVFACSGLSPIAATAAPARVTGTSNTASESVTPGNAGDLIVGGWCFNGNAVSAAWVNGFTKITDTSITANGCSSAWLVSSPGAATFQANLGASITWFGGAASFQGLSVPVRPAQPGRTWLRRFHHRQHLATPRSQIILTNSFESGTSGTGLTTGNTGGIPGCASFDAITTTGAGTTATFDNAHVRDTLAGHLHFPAGVSATAYASWTAIGQQSQVWFRMYLYHTALPSANTRIWQADQGGVTLCGGVYISTAGNLLVVNGATSTVFTSTSVMPLSQWYRIEGSLLGSAAAGKLELYFFRFADGLAADEQSLLTSQNTSGISDSYRYGSFAAVTETSAWDLWIDDIGLSSYGYLGPSPVTGKRGTIALPGGRKLQRHRRATFGG